MNQKSSQKRQNRSVNNTANYRRELYLLIDPQLTPFQNILEMDLPIAIFSEISTNRFVTCF